MKRVDTAQRELSCNRHYRLRGIGLASMNDVMRVARLDSLRRFAPMADEVAAQIP